MGILRHNFDWHKKQRLPKIYSEGKKYIYEKEDVSANVFFLYILLFEDIRSHTELISSQTFNSKKISNRKCACALQI